MTECSLTLRINDTFNIDDIVLCAQKENLRTEIGGKRDTITRSAHGHDHLLYISHIRALTCLYI